MAALILVISIFSALTRGNFISRNNRACSKTN
jgi:hypothetical protein